MGIVRFKRHTDWIGNMGEMKQTSCGFAHTGHRYNVRSRGANAANTNIPNFMECRMKWGSTTIRK